MAILLPLLIADLVYASQGGDGICFVDDDKKNSNQLDM